MPSCPIWMVSQSDCDYHSFAVGGYYGYFAPGLIHDFQTLTTFGGLIFYTTFTTFTTFGTFMDKIWLRPQRTSEKRDIFCGFYGQKLSWKNMEKQEMEINGNTIM